MFMIQELLTFDHIGHQLSSIRGQKVLLLFALCSQSRSTSDTFASVASATGFATTVRSICSHGIDITRML